MSKVNRGGFPGLQCIRSKTTDAIPKTTLSYPQQKISVPVLSQPVPEVSFDVCTLSYSGTKGCVQEWYICSTCTGTASKGICASCVIHCHKGHDVCLSPDSPSHFFCDCGTGEMQNSCSLIPENLSTVNANELANRESQLDEYYADPDKFQALEKDFLAGGFNIDDFRKSMWRMTKGKGGLASWAKVQNVATQELGLTLEVADAYLSHFRESAGKTAAVNYEDFVEQVLVLQLRHMMDRFHVRFAAQLLPQRRPLSTFAVQASFAKGVVSFEEFCFMFSKQVGHATAAKETTRLKAATTREEENEVTAFSVRDLAVWYYTRLVGLQSRQRRARQIAFEKATNAKATKQQLQQAQENRESSVHLARMEELYPTIHTNPASMAKYKKLYKATARCSFAFTGRQGAVQDWGYCITCNGDKEKGICTVCALLHHEGHQLIRAPQRHPPQKFFCDCGAEDMKERCYAI